MEVKGEHEMKQGPRQSSQGKLTSDSARELLYRCGTGRKVWVQVERLFVGLGAGAF